MALANRAKRVNHILKPAVKASCQSNNSLLCKIKIKSYEDVAEKGN
ncbi:hypothetical protein HMPREF3202_01625 [Prevotella bivia]|uniref:Uncharacterized protein n=1 Tax=Prevotella bivia TaxID=28125 RepID=A0A137STL1_9BACT|nr:hypothetical protein HMPREF3202_01625 [Prevotella bivia]